MNHPLPATTDAARCPLCDDPNGCQLCTVATYKGSCWCAEVQVPDELIAQVPAELRTQVCICRACVMQFHRNKTGGNTPKILPGDFYFENGVMVLTTDYNRQRGWCCGNGCRHCPYETTVQLVKAKFA